MKTPRPGTIAAIIAEFGLEAIRGKPLSGPQTQYVSSTLIDKMLREYAANGDPLAKGAWRERLYGGATPDAEMVSHINPNVTQLSPPAHSPVSVPAALLVDVCNALHSGQADPHLTADIETLLGKSAIHYTRPASLSPQYALTVLGENGTLDSYETGPGPAITKTINCQSGVAGTIISMPTEFRPLLLQAFGEENDWPSYLRIAADDDVRVDITVTNDLEKSMTLPGIYSESRQEIVLGGMSREDGYKRSYAYIQSISFADGRDPLQAASTVSIWDHVPSPGFKSAVERLALPGPIEQLLQADTDQESRTTAECSR